MSTKTSLLAFFLWFQASFSFAINRYAVGDTLFVWATSGLTLRAEADFNGKKLDVVPFGAVLICQETKCWSNDDGGFEAVPAFQNKITNQKSPSLDLRGKFAKVKFGGKTGYIFDAYLSKLATPKVEWEVIGSKKAIRRGEIWDWLKQSFEVVSENQFVCEQNNFKEHNIIFKNGIIQQSTAFEKTANYLYLFPNLTREEGYLIFNVFNQYEVEVSLDEYLPWSFSFSKQIFKFEDGSCEFCISSTGINMVLISITCHC